MRLLLIAFFFAVPKVSFSEDPCPFNLGALCFYPAVGALYAHQSGADDYKDLRFSAILHRDFGNMTTGLMSPNRYSANFMVSPGEKFIDSAGLGVSIAVFRTRSGGWAVFNIGGLAKRYSDPNDVRGGAYLMLTYAPPGSDLPPELAPSLR